MPGVLMTTSHAASAARPPSAVAITPLSAPGLSSTRTGSTPSARSLRSEACPSLPRPQTPTRAPARSDQPSLGRVMLSFPGFSSFGERVSRGHEVRPDGVLHGRDLGWRRCVRAAGDLRRELLQQGGALAVGSRGGQDYGGAALVDLADALERLGARAEERGELRLELGLAERLTFLGEHVPELLRRHERSQDQVDEAALVALTAPVIEPLLRVEVEREVTAAEGTVVLRQPREPLPHPQLGPVAEGGEVVGHGDRACLQQLA